MGKHFQYRFEKHVNGCVPSVGRTPEQQLAYLNEKGFVATKERAKLARKIEAAKKTPVPPAKPGTPQATGNPGKSGGKK